MNIYLFNLIYSLNNFNYINYICLFFSYLYIYLLAFLLIIWIIYIVKRKMYFFSLLFLSTFFTWFIAELIKNITAIARPIVSNPIIIEKGFSFPSQHTAIVTVLGVVIFSLNKKLGILILISALFVGLSRIVLGVHYPVDVLGGWVLGGLIGFLFIRLFKNI